MRRLELDFHAATRRPWVALVIMSCGLGLFSLALVLYQQAASELATWQAALTKNQKFEGRQSDSTQAAPKLNLQQAREIAAANTVIRQLALPWEVLFKNIEQASGNDIALLAIEPDTKKKAVKLTAESRTAQDMLDFIKRLQASPVLEDVLLQRHVVQLKDPDKPLRFTVAVIWR